MQNSLHPYGLPTRLGTGCRFLGTILISFVVMTSAAVVDAKEPMAIFHVGNSLTDQAYGMHDIASCVIEKQYAVADAEQDAGILRDDMQQGLGTAFRALFST